MHIRSALHVPVLRDDVVRLLATPPCRHAVDGTLGTGGHAEAILRRVSTATLIGIDLDATALDTARRRLSPYSERVRLVHGNYRDLEDHLSQLDVDAVDAVLLDLGMSSLQLDDATRGFGFRGNGPLDMRMDRSAALRADDIVNRASAEEITELLRRFGEERFARRIAAAVCDERARSPIASTSRLAEIVREAVPRKYHRPGFDPATRTFQALRIAVNGELENLAAGLPAAWRSLRVGGVLVVISFHSLEDRQAKRFFHSLCHPCTCPPELPECVCGRLPTAELLTPKPIRPSPVEIAANPRARSARLRAARKVAEFAS